MSDERADACVALWTRGRWVRPSRVTVDLGSVPVVVRAFARAGRRAEPTDVPGVLIVDGTGAEPTAGAPLAEEGPWYEDRAALRRVRTLALSNDTLRARSARAPRLSCSRGADAEPGDRYPRLPYRAS